MPELIEISPENFTVYIEEILAIERVSFPTPWSYNAFRLETEKRISKIWVLILNGSVAGYLCFLTVEGEIQLLNLAVHPERRRNRLGWFLLLKLIEKGASEGARHIWLEVRPSNSEARNLYKKMGFIEEGIRPNYYSETGEDAITMSLELPGSGYF